MYTYDDYLKKKQEYGFADGEISDADDRLAQANPDAGISLLGYKNDWKTATNESARAFAHAGAEDIRKNWGGYSGGESGGSFVLTGMPEYEDPYEGAIQAQIKRMNREFTYDPATDPNTKYYTDMYRREGERAMKDTLGAVAATTGGIPSSYATAAAAQQRNYYAQQLTDKYPELYQQAFDRFMQEYDRDYQMLDVYAKMSDTEYGRWSDQQERDRQARQDKAAADQQAFENQYMLDELAFEKDTAAQEIAIKNNQIRIMEEELALNLRKFDHEKQTAIKDDAYRWAALIQEGKIAEAEQAYKNSALTLEEKGLAWDYAVNMAKIKEEARQFDINKELAETELKQNRDLADYEKDQAYNDMLRTIIGSNTDMSELAALEAMGFDTEAIREQVIQQIMGQTPEAAEEEGYPIEEEEYPLYENEGEETNVGASIPAHIQVILQKQAKGQKLTESEKIILEQYNKTGKIVR